MIPQIIYIIIIVAELTKIGIKHKTLKPYQEWFYSFWLAFVSQLLVMGLLYWGGFFDKLLK